MSVTDQTIEAEIQAKGLTAPRITPQDVQNIITDEYYFTAEDGASQAMGWTNFAKIHTHKDAEPLRQITICVLILKNGHKIVGVNTGPVSPENFDAELARKLARENATDQIWPLLGFSLRSKLAGWLE